MNDLHQLLNAFNKLADTNDWHKNHSPKNLASAITVEAAELLEIFQWLGEDESNSLNPSLRRQASHEMADVLLYLLSLADKLEVDLIAAAQEKMQINQQRQKSSGCIK